MLVLGKQAFVGYLATYCGSNIRMRDENSRRLFQTDNETITVSVFAGSQSLIGLEYDILLGILDCWMFMTTHSSERMSILFS